STLAGSEPEAGSIGAAFRAGRDGITAHVSYRFIFLTEWADELARDRVAVEDVALVGVMAVAGVEQRRRRYRAECVAHRRDVEIGRELAQLVDQADPLRRRAAFELCLQRRLQEHRSGCRVEDRACRSRRGDERRA